MRPLIRRNLLILKCVKCVKFLGLQNPSTKLARKPGKARVYPAHKTAWVPGCQPVVMKGAHEAACSRSQAGQPGKRAERHAAAARLIHCPRRSRAVLAL